jgi:glycosyltransferase involved in cell wall biosynthesis
MKTPKFLVNKKRQLCRLSKSRLIAAISSLINGDHLSLTRKLQTEVLHSKGVRLYQLAISDADTNVNPEPIGTNKLAYAIASFEFLSDDTTLARSSIDSRQVLRLPLFAALYWLETSTLQIKYPLSIRRKAYLGWWLRNAPPHLCQADQILEASAISNKPKSHFCDRAFGVNLIGHAFNVSGLGEYLRMIAKAFDAAAIPYCVIDVPIGNGASDQDRSLEGKALPNDVEPPYAFDLFCMTGISHLNLAIYHGFAASPRTYTIAIWFWELEKWPAQLANTLDLANEYWPCTRIIEQALQSARTIRQKQGLQTSGSTPIIHMPPVMDLGITSLLSDQASDRKLTREAYGLDQESILFNFVFDLNSMIARKNPQAVLKAFQQAFATTEFDVGLVIKTFPPRRPEPLWDLLKAAAATDKRITIIEADLDRSSILALLACCDVYVSLHRSEGLGIGLAEALQLGLDVIATDYGGNTDFCSGPLAHPIPYHLIPIEQGEYPYHQGMVWAEPDLDAAVAVMRQVAMKRMLSPTTDQTTVDSYRQRFSAAEAGAHFRRRLEDLWLARHQVQQIINGDSVLSQQ